MSDERDFAEIDATLLFIEDARRRAERSAKALRSAGAEAHLIEAVERAQQRLSDAHRELMQGTLFAVPRRGE